MQVGTKVLFARRPGTLLPATVAGDRGRDVVDLDLEEDGSKKLVQNVRKGNLLGQWRPWQESLAPPQESQDTPGDGGTVAADEAAPNPLVPVAVEEQAPKPRRRREG